jgi:hypothetical protein
MLYLRYTLAKPALYSVHNASRTIAKVRINSEGPPTVTPARRLSTEERSSIEAFATMKL